MSDDTAPAGEAKEAPPAAPEPAPGPDADELRRVEGLYDLGDFREVNRRAQALAERSPDEVVKARARTLVDRVQLDPFVLYAWGGSVLVLAAIVYYYVLQ